MANDASGWVRERLQVLQQGAAETPDAEIALVRVRERSMTERPFPQRSSWHLWRWATAATALCLASVVMLTLPARAQRSRVAYTAELEQAFVEIRPDGAERVLQRKTIRIRGDGAHETTTALHWPLSFITQTRVVFPGGHAETFFDLIPIAKTDNPEVPAATKVAAGCVSEDGSESVAGREMLHGFSTVVTQSQVRGGQILSWRAPELGCEELKVRVGVLLPNGSTRGVVETRTLRVRR